MMATRSAMVSASAWSWVTYSVVTPSSRVSPEISARSSARSPLSRLDSGSSIRNRPGRRTIARPIATRWRWPPDSCEGRRASTSPMPRALATSATRSPRVPDSTPDRRSGKPMLSPTVMCGYSAKSWNTMAIRRSRGARSLASSPSSRMAPAVGSSRPATIRRTVDLPHPEGPSSTMNSPSPTSRLRLSTATVPSPKILVTSLSATVATPPPPKSRQTGRPADPPRTQYCDETRPPCPSAERADLADEGKRAVTC